ncbi:MAG: hypothetical protein JNL70_23255 [Saprospiraceae bacterium]|nr:hypothetical protein [Saprospiraceae bacterium]
MNCNRNIQLLLLLGFLIISVFAQAQTGLLEDDEDYKKATVIQLPSGSKSDLPPSVDLTSYCPFVGNQGKISSCVGWSVGYGLMTITKAIQDDETDRKKITDEAYSALFVYNQVRSSDGNCNSGSNMTDALTFIANSGNCLAKEFGFNVEDCYVRPESGLKMRAQRNKIAGFNRLFNTDTDPNIKVDVMRKVLAKKKPLAIGLKINEQFKSLFGKEYWNPLLGAEPVEGHAMVVVGYDDALSCFIVMNSWGKVWGKEGFIKIKYKDMGNYCRYAYAIHNYNQPQFSEPIAMTVSGMQAPKQSLIRPTVASNNTPNTNNNTAKPTNTTPQPQKAAIAEQKPMPKKQETVSSTQPKPVNNSNVPTNRESENLSGQEPRELVEMSGSIDINYYTKRKTNTGEPIFETLGVERAGDHYILANKNWRVGDQFQLALTSKINGAYVYVISLNPRYEAKIMYPRNEVFGERYKGFYEDPLLMLDGARVVLPNTKQAITVDFTGTDRVCILFSTRKITGIPILCEQLRAWKGNFDAHFQNLIKAVMVPLADTDYATDKVAFETSTRSNGSIVPIIIEFQSQ